MDGIPTGLAKTIEGNLRSIGKKVCFAQDTKDGKTHRGDGRGRGGGGRDAKNININTNMNNSRKSNGTQKIGNLIAERGELAARDEQGTMGWGSGGRGRRRKKICRITHVRFHP